MWWFGRHKWVVVLRRDGVEVFGERQDKKWWDYPRELIINQEVVNREELVKRWGEYWGSWGRRGDRVWIVMGEELIYQKEVGKTEEGKSQEFWDEVPIEPAKMVRIVIDRGDKLTLVAARIRTSV